MYAVGLIFVRFDWYLRKFDLFVRLDLYLYGSIDICVSSIYMYAVRFILVRFDLYERVLKILSVTERHS